MTDNFTPFYDPNDRTAQAITETGQKIVRELADRVQPIGVDVATGNIIELAARTAQAIETPPAEYQAAAVMIDIISDHLDRLIVDMSRVRDDAPSGDRLRADFRHSLKHLERALDSLVTATERLK